MPSLFAKLLLFASSYAPLMLIFVIRDSFQSIGWNAALLLVTLSSIVGLFIYMRVARRLAAHDVATKRVNPRSGDALAYIVTYLIPFLSVDLIGLRNALSLVLLILLIGFLYINSTMLYVNPVLNLFGYRTFEVESEDGKVSALLTRRNYIAAGETLRVRSLADYILLEAPR